MVVFAIMFHLIYEFSQLYFIAVNLPTELFGIANALLTISFTIGAFGAVAIRKINKSSVYISAALLFVVSQLAMYFVRNNWAIAVMFIGAVLIQTLDTFAQREIQDRIPSSERAATTSLLGSIGRAAAIPLSVLVGYLTDKYDFFATVPIYVFFAMLLAAILVVVTFRRHNQEPKLVAKDSLPW